MPWQKNYNETEVIEKAMQSFWAHGYEATSMNDLVKATGINRGSIYSAFPNKHALFMRALQHYDQIYRERHLQQFAQDYEPVDAIVAVFESAATGCDKQNSPKGCLLVNTALELSPHDSEVSQFVERSLRAVEDFFYQQIVAAKQKNQLAGDIDARRKAQALLGLFLGLRVLTRAQSPQPTIEAITSQARMMLE